MNELLLIIRKTVRKKDDAEAAQAATDAKEYLFKARLTPVLPLARVEQVDHLCHVCHFRY